MKELHDKQKRLIELLLENEGDPLTLKELADRLGLSSPSVVHHHIGQLEKRGFLRRDPNNPTNYQILGEPEKQVAYLNLYGLAKCGPDGSILDGNPKQRIPISTSLLKFPSREAFLVEADGDSMMPEINPNDYVIARKTFEQRNGSIVVCVNNEMALIKKLLRGKDRDGNDCWWLYSLNSKYTPIQQADDFRVEGLVQGLAYRHLN